MSARGSSRPSIVALYFPQFYSIAGSAAGSEAGLSEWLLVARAQPLFPGHEQPRRPADLGYCDLRVPEVRQAQADLARAYGIDAFCYLHYWIEGRRLFDRPFAEVLASGAPDLPFCLCWMNEDWRRPVLLQSYSAADDLAHAAYLARAFADPRYLRVGGRPVFVVRRPNGLAAPAATLAAIRAAAAARGVGDPLLIGAGDEAAAGQTLPPGFDVMLDWPEAGGALPGAHSPGARSWRRALANLLRRRWLPRLTVAVESRWRAHSPPLPAGRIAVALVGRDDTPERGADGTVLEGRSPRLFEAALTAALTRAAEAPQAERLVFIEAWNAWAEGATLEPDRRFGRAYLAAVARARIGTSPPDERARR